MRNISGELDRQVVADVDRRLDDVALEHGVRIGWAVESGSRAWGFPSPDSDYDCRFLYVRPLRDHLTPWPPRDVIETPLDAVLDVNGWDLRKAVALMVRGNATVPEWLQSSIVYRGDEWFRDRLLDLAQQVCDRSAVARHYLHLGRRQLARHGGVTFGGGSGAGSGPGDALGSGEVKLKRVFYALRPAAALRWLEVHPQAAVPPIALRKLLVEGEVAPVLLEAVEELIAIKAVTRETGLVGPLPVEVREFLVEQLEGEDRGLATAAPRLTVNRAREIAVETFQEVLSRYGG